MSFHMTSGALEPTRALSTSKYECELFVIGIAYRPAVQCATGRPSASERRACRLAPSARVLAAEARNEGVPRDTEDHPVPVVQQPGRGGGGVLRLRISRLTCR